MYFFVPCLLRDSENEELKSYTFFKSGKISFLAEIYSSFLR